MFEKTKEVKIKQFIAKGVVVNEFLKDSFLKELEKKLGKGYHLISNHLDLVVVKEKKGKKHGVGTLTGFIHLGHKTPRDYNEREVLVSSSDENIFKKLQGKHKHASH